MHIMIDNTLGFFYHAYFIINMEIKITQLHILSLRVYCYFCLAFKPIYTDKH